MNISQDSKDLIQSRVDSLEQERQVLVNQIVEYRVRIDALKASKESLDDKIATLKKDIR